MLNRCVEYQFKVYPRFDDFDIYGILHHSRYLLYIEEAKFALMNDPKYFGLDILEQEEKFLISDIQLKYLSAVKYCPQEPIIVKLKFFIVQEIKIVFEFCLFYQEKLSCKGEAVHLITGQNDQLKLSIPQKLIDRYAYLMEGSVDV